MSVQKNHSEDKRSEVSSKHDFLSGKNGVVWASFNHKQSEIIQNTLLVQNIHCEIKRCVFEEYELFLISITKETDREEAMDFIWRSKSGLCLEPDWFYSNPSENASFNKWLNAI